MNPKPEDNAFAAYTLGVETGIALEKQRHHLATAAARAAAIALAETTAPITPCPTWCTHDHAEYGYDVHTSDLTRAWPLGMQLHATHDGALSVAVDMRGETEYLDADETTALINALTAHRETLTGGAR